MHIQEIILDGFKSYSVKTHITQLDKNFNAITGLNGSGKSNVIDAICFVLGISSLAHVRVTNLQELIYKRGNAGVVKASVTIIFDNRNKSCSPPTMIAEDKIVVTRSIYDGKSKFILNGRTEQAEKMRQLFMSVQLNINNPHFMVMQGRIAQTIQMKPQQILSLIEEASGTSLYENRKLASMKLIQKKQLKVEEITSIVTTEIYPQLEKLEKEKKILMKFKSNESEINFLSKQITAFDFHKNQVQKEAKKSEVERLRVEGETLVKKIDDQKMDIERLDEEIQTQKKTEISAIKHQWESLQRDLSKLEKDLIEKQSNYKNNERTIRENDSVCKKLTRFIEDLERNISKSKHRREEVVQLVRQFRRDYELKKEQVKSVLQSLRDMDDGKEVNLQKSVGLQEQMVEVKKNMGQYETKLKSQQSWLNRQERERVECKENLDSITKSNEMIKAQIHKKQIAIKQGIEDLQKKQVNGRIETERVNECKKLEDQQKQLQQKLDDIMGLSIQNGGNLQGLLNVDYQPPNANFDRSLVKGRVVRLITVKEERYSIALEEAAGEKLFAIICETDIVCSILIKNKCFIKHKAILIPNNRINNFKEASSEVIDYVANVTKGKAKHALSLISYNAYYDKSIRSVFADVFVCDDADTAKKLAFDPRVNMRCVTVDGTMFDPDGVISGGCDQKKNESILERIKIIQQTEEDLKINNQKQSECKQDLINIQKRQRDYFDQKQKVEVLEHQLKKLKDRYDSEGRDKHTIKLKNLDEDITESKINIKTYKEFITKFSNEITKLDQDIEEFDQKTDEHREILENKLQQLKEDIEQVSKDLKKYQRDVDKLEYEAEENVKDLTRSKNQIEMETIEKQKLVENSAEYKKQVEDFQKLKQSKRDKLKELQQDQLKATNKIKDKIELKAKFDRGRDLNLHEVKRIDQRIQKLNTEIGDFSSKLNMLEKENPWIMSEKAMFAKKEFPIYEFGPTFNIKQQTIKFYRLKEENTQLRMHVNIKVDQMADQASEEYTALIKKKDKIICDKQEIEKSIEELDHLKNKTLEQTFNQVNKNFRDIFGTLLPGAMAEIERVDPDVISEGMKIKIGFNNQWKEGLSELSGGQRSLLALSFVLGLLKYKPAPIYILDEIDAALDLSHTQNIGKMIKTYFPQSQFLIISLKEGMFTHANVLYKVEFQEGKSKITRYANRKK